MSKIFYKGDNFVYNDFCVEEVCSTGNLSIQRLNIL